ncbi:hypothetical protein [Pseudomonas sp. TWP3-1]|uniref:hypothetical protein n=1 Tax=unclassified Pseudomonas TaxID=196821 RepID=UPI003CE9FB72
MNIRLISILLIIAISLAVIGGLHWLIDGPMLIIAQAQVEDASSDLIIEILLSVAAHSAAVALIPLVLAFFRQTVASYVVFILLLAFDIQILTGLNALGVAVAGLMIVAVAYGVITKTANLMRYLRAK